MVAATGWSVPEVVAAPLDEIGAAAVPLVLMAFGMSLHGNRPLAAGSPRRAILVASGLKVVVMPAVAYLLALALRLPEHLLFAVVVTAALPTAQNMNNYAARYAGPSREANVPRPSEPVDGADGRNQAHSQAYRAPNQAQGIARDTVALSTVASVPVILALTALLR
ncbi:MAG: AEC family transporter [Cellulomonas sp.]|nr:AEC family transporter [Cellulomonas sp.]